MVEIKIKKGDEGRGIEGWKMGTGGIRENGREIGGGGERDYERRRGMRKIKMR